MVYLQGKTISQVAREMCVSHSSVERFLHLYRSTGEVGSMHGPERMLDQIEEHTILQSLLNIYLREVQEKLYEVTGKWASCATVCRTVKHLGLTRQKTEL